MRRVNGGNEQSFFTAAGERFLSSYLPLILYLRACVRGTTIPRCLRRPRNFPPLFRPRACQQFLSKVRGAISRIKADSVDMSGVRETRSHRLSTIYIFSVAAGQHSPVSCLPRVGPAIILLRLSSRSSSSLLNANGRSCRATELHPFARILIAHVTVLFQGKRTRKRTPLHRLHQRDTVVND